MNTKIRIALFRSVEFSGADPMPWSTHMEGVKGYARVSEYVDVEFPPLSDDVVIKQQLDALDRTEQELREQFQRHLDGLKSRRAELLALTFVPAACTCPGTFPPEPGCHYSGCPAVTSS